MPVDDRCHCSVSKVFEGTRSVCRRWRKGTMQADGRSTSGWALDSCCKYFVCILVSFVAIRNVPFGGRKNSDGYARSSTPFSAHGWRLRKGLAKLNRRLWISQGMYMWESGWVCWTRFLRSISFSNFALFLFSEFVVGLQEHKLDLLRTCFDSNITVDAADEEKSKEMASLIETDMKKQCKKFNLSHLLLLAGSLI